MEHENNGDNSCYYRAQYSYRRIGTGTGTGGLENKRTSGDHSN